MKPSELILCNATLAPESFVCSAEDFRRYVDAAVQAGFGGISLWGSHHGLALQDGLSADEALALHVDRGLRVPMVEALLQWASGPSAAADAEAVELFDLGQRFGARYATAVSMDPTLAARDDVVRSFARLCDMAAERDLGVSLEFLPWSGIRDLRTGWQIVREAGRENGGLLLDTWHWMRSGPDEETLRSIPPERIHILQLCDAPRQPESDLMQEAMQRRLLPGEGVG